MTFDIECANWNSFCVGCVYDGHLPRLFYDIDDMIDYMRKRGGVAWGHAAGVYDSLLVLERARRRGIVCQIDKSQHRVTRVVMGSLTLRDSYAIWPTALDEICGAVGISVPRLPWKCTCGKRCAGYCQIGKKAREGDPDLESYVIADCRALYDGLHKLHEFALDSDIELRGTLGQTAWLAAQSEIGVPDSTMSWHTWRHARRGDRGGRAAIIRPKTEGPGSHHDICNAYPAQLAKASLPIGDVSELGERHAMRALIDGWAGMYTCTVNVPSDLFLPPLPWLHGGSLNFPTGKFTGTWTLPELACAFERGVALEACHSAIVWEATAPMFGDLIRRWYEIRRTVGRKTPLGQWIGRLPKALTGKFAERPERNRVTMHPDEIKVCLRRKACRNGCTGRCGAYEQLDLDGEIWAIPFQHLGPSTYPQWSAYLRAMTRVQWLEQAERYGEDLCFGNTDSLWTIGRASPSPLGDGLGEWEYQGAWCELEVRSASVYAYRELAGGGPPVLDVVKTKRAKRAIYKYEPGEQHIMGIPGLTPADWKRGSGVLDRGIVTFGQAVRGTGDGVGGLFQPRRRAWTLPGSKNRGGGERIWYGDRKLASNGVTYPVDAQELRERVKAQRDRVVEHSKTKKPSAKMLEQMELDDPAEAPASVSVGA